MGGACRRGPPLSVIYSFIQSIQEHIVNYITSLNGNSNTRTYMLYIACMRVLSDRASSKIRLDPARSVPSSLRARYGLSEEQHPRLAKQSP